jgi:hypothetical protein
MKEEIRSKIKVGVDDEAENRDRVAMIESLGKSMKTQT